LAELDDEWPASKEAKQAAAARIGRLIKEVRVDVGLSVEHLADPADVNPSLIYRLEAGAKLPSRFRMARVVSVLENALVGQLRGA